MFLDKIQARSCDDLVVDEIIAGLKIEPVAPASETDHRSHSVVISVSQFPRVLPTDSLIGFGRHFLKVELSETLDSKKHMEQLVLSESVLA